MAKKPKAENKVIDKNKKELIEQIQKEENYIRNMEEEVNEIRARTAKLGEAILFRRGRLSVQREDLNKLTQPKKKEKK